MKKFTSMLGGSLLAAALALPVMADDYGRMGRDKMKDDGMMSMKGHCMMDEHGMHGDCMMTGSHSMTGKVDKIDPAKGTLVLKHGAADMLLHFPPAAIKDLRNGDTITVHLGFSKGGSGGM
ncbi:MAG: hypothetical protein WAW02_02955 [Sideroxyarcus sp.]